MLNGSNGNDTYVTLGIDGIKKVLKYIHSEESPQIDALMNFTNQNVHRDGYCQDPDNNSFRPNTLVYIEQQKTSIMMV